MQSWVEVPAAIKQVELQSSHCAARKSRGSVKVVAVYEYRFGGQRFKGQRVGIYEGTDNLGSFQSDTFHELKRRLDSKKPYHCYVNPQSPHEAVLDRELRRELLALITLFGAFFGSIGFGLLIGGIVAGQKMPRVVASEMPPDQPWLARSDWATGEIIASGGATLVAPVLAIVALYWNIASWPLVSKLPVILSQPGSRWAWITLAFPVIGLLLVVRLVHQFLRARKFGQSTLQLAATPGVIGGQLAGVVRIPQHVYAQDGFHLKLSCVERMTGRDNKANEALLWQEEQLITEPILDGLAESTAIPVLFAIPYGAQESSRPDSAREISWKLELSAKMPGVDYKSRFDVPVFKTTDSRRGFQLDQRLKTEFVAAPSRELVLREARIAKEPLPGGGVRLVFPAARNLGSALFVSAFLVLWSGIIWLMIHVGTPFLFPIIFGLFEIFFVWIAIDLWFYRSVVEARSEGLTFRGGLLGIGRQKSWAADDVKRFATSQSMSSGTKVWKNFDVVLRSGKRRTIAQSIEGRLAQQAVMDELNAALGRGADTSGEGAEET